jgi:hypothetical protein
MMVLEAGTLVGRHGDTAKSRAQRFKLGHHIEHVGDPLLVDGRNERRAMWPQLHEAARHQLPQCLPDEVREAPNR